MNRSLGIAALLAVVVAATLLVGCGRDTVDRAEEARALVATCRSIQERSTGRPARTVDRAVIDRFLASEPGAGGDRSTTSVVRQICAAATRSASAREGSEGSPSRFPFPGPGRP